MLKLKCSNQALEQRGTQDRATWGQKGVTGIKWEVTIIKGMKLQYFLSLVRTLFFKMDNFYSEMEWSCLNHFSLRIWNVVLLLYAKLLLKS